MEPEGILKAWITKKMTTSAMETGTTNSRIMLEKRRLARPGFWEGVGSMVVMVKPI